MRGDAATFNMCLIPHELRAEHTLTTLWKDFHWYNTFPRALPEAETNPNPGVTLTQTLT